jgi:hypothetical protein
MAQSWWFDQFAKIIMLCITVSFLFSKNEKLHSKDTREIITINEAKKLTKQREYDTAKRNQQMKKLLNTTGLSNMVSSIE